jgi:hypothetical protein
MGKFTTILIILFICTVFFSCLPLFGKKLTVTFTNATIIANGQELTSNESMSFYKGSEVILKVYPNNGYVMGGWMGNNGVEVFNNDDGTHSITMDTDKEVIANIVDNYTALASTWIAGEKDYISMAIDSNKNFALHVYSEDDDSWHTYASGNNIIMNNNGMKFEYKYIDMSGSGLQEVEQPYSLMSACLFDGSTLVAMSHPFYILSGYIMKGGDDETLLGTWVSEIEFIQTESGSTDTQELSVTLTLNDDDTYSFLVIENSFSEIDEEGTYTIDEVAQEITLSPNDDKDIVSTYPYKVIQGGFLLGGEDANHEDLESLIFSKSEVEQ